MTLAITLAGCSNTGQPTVAGALAVLGLHQPDSVTISGPPHVRLQPDGLLVVGGITLTNGSSRDWRFPFELTVLSWNGSTWGRVACREASGPGPIPTDFLCGDAGQSAQLVRAAETVPSSDLRMLALSPAGPTASQSSGVYAFVLPLWAGYDAGAGGEIIEGQPDAAVAFIADASAITSAGDVASR